jgi:hypothetical protein
MHDLFKVSMIFKGSVHVTYSPCDDLTARFISLFVDLLRLFRVLFRLLVVLLLSILLLHLLLHFLCLLLYHLLLLFFFFSSHPPLFLLLFLDILLHQFGDNFVRVSISESGRFDGPESGSLWGIDPGSEVLVRPPATTMTLRDFITLAGGQNKGTKEIFYVEYLALTQYLGEVKHDSH